MSKKQVRALMASDALKVFKSEMKKPRAERTFEVTICWLKSCSTGQAGYSKVQLATLGIQWPPFTGWMRDLEGLWITPRLAEAFSGKSERVEPFTERVEEKAAIVPQEGEKPKPIQDDKWTIGPGWTWPFGKHKGVTLAETPLSYLVWVAENFKKGIIKKTVQREIANRAPEVARKMRIKVDEVVDGMHVQGRYDSSHLFDPLSDWPEEIPWDGTSAPWEDPRELNAEFKEIVG